MCSFDCNIKDHIKIFVEVYFSGFLSSKIIRSVKIHLQEGLLRRRMLLKGQRCLIFHEGHAQTNAQFSKHAH